MIFVVKVRNKPKYFEIDNGVNTYRLMKELSYSMSANTIDALSTPHTIFTFYEKAKEKGDARPMNVPQHIKLFEDAVKAGDPDLLDHLMRGVRSWPMTLTRVIYNPVGEKDEIIHNYGTSDAYSIFGDFIGKCKGIEKIDNKNALEGVTGTRDINKLNNLSQAVNQSKMSLNLIDSKVFKKDERIVKLDAYYSNFLIDATWHLKCRGPVFLVEPVK